MVTNGQMQIANGMRSDGRAMGDGRLEVPPGPARPVCRRGAPGPGATTPAPLRILKSGAPDEYPLIVSVLLVNKELRQPSVRIIEPGMMASRA
jgi:hypothetical protein